MPLIAKIKQDQLAARKARDVETAATLTTLIGEAEAIGKNDGNREVTDAEVVAMVKKFIKNVDITLEAFSLQKFDEGGRIAATQAEKRLLESYLPQQLTSDELKAAIILIVEERAIGSGGLGQKPNIGTIMQDLRAQYEGQYDGKAASATIKEILG